MSCMHKHINLYIYVISIVSWNKNEMDLTANIYVIFIVSIRTNSPSPAKTEQNKVNNKFLLRQKPMFI